ncbi:CmpA/NrtA family ABC transporter substrate-binding protein [Jannaschia sp. LMIT008]|uniref:CmpA/NrtA family ABC transporter substrate-binding protein n=1 Tax=Jannaschia maritima TaxID=3032585 RepID=UPI0028122FE9|nr:CmpA/NrtA family ABC transporter substrate-binding protein [Jannaschia sp. LMIT008]
MNVPLRIAHLRLVDAAPLIVARDLGFAEAEGLALDLVAEPSWSALRDTLTSGRVAAAQMLSVMPVAMALGLGGVPGEVEALQVLSVNGDVIGLSQALSDRLGALPFGDAHAAGAALLSAAERAPVRIGVPFPFSMHAELLHYWLDQCGPPNRPNAIQVRTVPPPLMTDALAAGEIDAFCVGEPWGSWTVDRGAGVLVLPGSAIWAQAPEKVLAARVGWAEAEPDLARALLRALHRAARWLDVPANMGLAADMLARPGALDLPSELIERALSGRLSTGTGHAVVPGLLRFHAGAAAFPWRSQGAWIADRLARRHDLDRGWAQAAGRRAFRSDLYRRFLQDVVSDLPGASSKIEGALSGPTPVASHRGTLTLGPDSFFDGQVFEPLPSD